MQRLSEVRSEALSEERSEERSKKLPAELLLMVVEAMPSAEGIRALSRASPTLREVVDKFIAPWIRQLRIGAPFA